MYACNRQKGLGVKYLHTLIFVACPMLIHVHIQLALIEYIASNAKYSIVDGVVVCMQFNNMWDLKLLLRT